MYVWSLRGSRTREKIENRERKYVLADLFSRSPSFFLHQRGFEHFILFLSGSVDFFPSSLQSSFSHDSLSISLFVCLNQKKDIYAVSPNTFTFLSRERERENWRELMKLQWGKKCLPSLSLSLFFLFMDVDSSSLHRHICFFFSSSLSGCILSVFLTCRRRKAGKINFPVFLLCFLFRVYLAT